MNTTLFIIKPHALSMALSIQSDICNAGFKIIKSKEIKTPTLEQWKNHYLDLKDRSYYTELCTEMYEGGSIIVLLAELDGELAWKKGREILNDLRKKYGISIRHNAVHASDSLDAVIKESSIWFV